MKLIDALETTRRPVPDGAPRLFAALACGFTPLHLQTFFAAELRRAHPTHRVDLATGLFGDLPGTLARAAAAETDAIAAVVEWADVDPRLGHRSLGGWRRADVQDVLASADRQLRKLGDALRGAAVGRPVACCLPTLPLPPAFSHGPGESGPQELRLRELVASFAATLADEAGVRIVSAQALDAASPPAARFDLASEIRAGFPYTVTHAAQVAAALAGLFDQTPPKKGLITDLDDTLWAGLVGEVGADGVAWTLDRDAQEHGLYQQLLASLADAGVLIGVASKNEPDVVSEVFRRSDLVLPQDAVFPFDVGWGPKSEAVGRILREWNIGPDAVVFVDDSGLELAEVEAAFPGIECIAFPKGDHEAFGQMLTRLRALFAKRTVSAEDSLRLQSVRTSRAVREEARSAVDPDEFLRSVGGAVAFSRGDEQHVRAFELLNKTNQFNLNGRRLSEAEWHRALADPAAFLVTVDYRDRFGPLGTIAAILGRKDGRDLFVDAWVMSCRAFSRRIEHHSLAHLFDSADVDRVVLAYEPTERNGVLREFLESLFGSSVPPSPLRVERRLFEERAPAFVHEVSEGVGA